MILTVVTPDASGTRFNLVFEHEVSGSSLSKYNSRISGVSQIYSWGDQLGFRRDHVTSKFNCGKMGNEFNLHEKICILTLCLQVNDAQRAEGWFFPTMRRHELYFDRITRFRQFYSK